MNGRTSLSKIVISCGRPLSNTSKSSRVEIGDEAVIRVDDRHVRRHDSRA